MLMAFLASALEDTGAEAESTITHFSQAQQKIMLNHIQLISLASGFPLKWPDDIQVVRDLFCFLLGSRDFFAFLYNFTKMQKN